MPWVYFADYINSSFSFSAKGYANLQSKELSVKSLSGQSSFIVNNMSQNDSILFNRLEIGASFEEDKIVFKPILLQSNL